MLGKLIKNEWKSTYKVGCLMLIVLLVVTFFGWLSWQSPMWQAIGGNTEVANASIWDVFSIFMMMIYMVMLVGVIYGILIYLGVHFYKTMYTDQGYLIHTLPVTKHQILGSKILVSGLWYMIIMLAVYASMILWILSLASIAIPEGYSLASAWKEIAPELGNVLEGFKTELGWDLKATGIYMIFYTLIAPFTGLTILFGSITLGQLFHKARVLMAIVCYIGVSVLMSLFASVFQSFNSVNMFTDLAEEMAFGKYMNGTLGFTMVVNLIIAVILYFVSHYIISKKLNME